MKPHVILLDLYTNLDETLAMLSKALWPRTRIHQPDAIISLEDYIVKARLPTAMGAEMRDCVAGITDFWLSLDDARRIPDPEPGTTAVFHVSRPDTVGSRALDQTIKWLRRKGYNNPVVWNDA